MTRGTMALVAVGLAACAPIPPPDALGHLDAVRATPASREGSRLAPPAYAHAEQLRHEARAAFERGDLAGAQLLAERAVAAYARAAALARSVRAEEARVAADAEETAARERLRSVETELQKVMADVAAMEARLRVLRDLEPTVPSGPADPARERARLDATRELALGARLLCTAARLLWDARTPAPEPPAAEQGEGTPAAAPTETPPAEVAGELERALAAQSALETRLGAMPEGGSAPIDEAMRARAGCLRALTVVRRATGGGGAAASGDAVVDALSRARVGEPRRDDRGVVLALRGLFAGDQLSADGRARVRAVADILRNHPPMPVLVVVHAAREPDARGLRTLRERARALGEALREALPGGLVSEPEIAGASAPLVDPRGPQASYNERVELVVVTPRSL